jgi:hypothetical protein
MITKKLKSSSLLQQEERIDLSQVKILKSNKHYRLSDLFYMLGGRWEEDRQVILTKPEYQDTILYDYLVNHNKEQDYDALKTAIKSYINRNPQEEPTHDELVVHLRLGDIMDLDRRRRRATKSYVKQNIADRINPKAQGITKVTIVTALHYGSNERDGKNFYSEKSHDDSLKLLRHVENQFREKGLPVKLKSSENFDEDLVYMVASNHFVRSRTQLTEIIVTLLKDGARIYDIGRIKSKTCSNLSSIVKYLSTNFRRGEHSK